MRVDFDDDDLRRLYADGGFRLQSIGPVLTKAYRKRVGILLAATDERDLYAMRSNRFEKLKGDRGGQHSLRLNDQWRLIVRLDADADGTKIVVVEIVDYH